jgi:serine/threonine protein kinase
MLLSVGSKLGPYEILAPIGAGGMGEVYRARDPRLNREVAIKVSQERFSDRFERETRAVAALNHPNICQVYDVGPNYLVMEFIEGESPKGPMPLDEALRIARQIADALEAPHEKGIVHRDLKPANIRVKPDGTVKVLDFGLAKNVEPASGDPRDSPTITFSATHAGMILGTAAYMSPEQARGKVVDKRTDIWAFGVVLFEMLTGRRLFHGEDVTETLASVVKDTPDLSAAPPQVRPLLESCLEKSPRNRLRDIGDWARLLEPAPAATPQAKRTSVLPWAIVAVSIMAAISLGGVAWRHFAEEPEILRLTLPVPEKAEIVGYAALPTISPDGHRVAYTTQVSGSAGLWLRDLDGLNTRLLPGTEGAKWPFWSPTAAGLPFLPTTNSGRST